MTDFLSATIEILGLVASSFSWVWMCMFFLGFLIVVVDVIHYHLLGAGGRRV